MLSESMKTRLSVFFFVCYCSMFSLKVILLQSHFSNTVLFKESPCCEEILLYRNSDYALAHILNILNVQCAIQKLLLNFIIAPMRIG